MDRVEALLPADSQEELAERNLKPLQIAIVGRPNVGKSSLTNAILEDDRTLVSPISGTTRDAVDIPVTVKHRIGVDRIERYEFVRDFVGTVSEAGCAVFIVHARNAWLDGLSPKENREIPPLRYELAYRLKQDFPALTIAVNGGIKDNEGIAAHLQQVDGVMVGREAYYNPWLLTTWDAAFFGQAPSAPDREVVEEAMVAYMERAHAEDGCPWYAIARHMLGLYHGQRGGRLWRQVWSNHKLKPLPPLEVWRQAREALARGAALIA
jgi:tRNA-dihydrouridine synthase A